MSDACRLLHERLAQLTRLGANFSPDDVPLNGVYVMFERGERAHGTDRIVHVGMHRGGGNLRQRLSEHYRKANKDRSIFRKHLGRCLLAARDDPFLRQWEINLTTRAARERHTREIDHEHLQAVEQEVSDYLARSFTFVALPVVAKNDRATIKRGLLATVATCGDCHPSDQWLGRHHPDATLRQVGLWNVQGLKGRPFTTHDIDDLVNRCSGTVVCPPR